MFASACAALQMSGLPEIKAILEKAIVCGTDKELFRKRELV